LDDTWILWGIQWGGRRESDLAFAGIVDVMLASGGRLAGRFAPSSLRRLVFFFAHYFENSEGVTGRLGYLAVRVYKLKGNGNSRFLRFAAE
jgi:hypothetical protein